MNHIWHSFCSWFNDNAYLRPSLISEHWGLLEDFVRGNKVIKDFYFCCKLKHTINLQYVSRYNRHTYNSIEGQHAISCVVRHSTAYFSLIIVSKYLFHLPWNLLFVKEISTVWHRFYTHTNLYQLNYFQQLKWLSL